MNEDHDYKRLWLQILLQVLCLTYQMITYQDYQVLMTLILVLVVASMVIYFINDHIEKTSSTIILGNLDILEYSNKYSFVVEIETQNKLCDVSF